MLFEEVAACFFFSFSLFFFNASYYSSKSAVTRSAIERGVKRLERERKQAENKGMKTDRSLEQASYRK